MKKSSLFLTCLLYTITGFSQFVSVGVDTSVVLPVSQVRIGSFFVFTDEPLYLDTCWMDVYAPPEYADLLQDVRIIVDGEHWMSQSEIPDHWEFFPSILVNFANTNGKQIDIYADINQATAEFLELYLYCYLRPLINMSGLYTNNVIGHRISFLHTGIVNISTDWGLGNYDQVYDILGRLLYQPYYMLESGTYIGIKDRKRDKFFVP